jgi:hypothetical protein
MINVTYSGQGKDRKAKIDVDNGDLQALTDVLKQYGFVNEQALIRYALVALLRSDDNNLYIKNGDRVAALKINEDLLKPQKPDDGDDNPNGEPS